MVGFGRPKIVRVISYKYTIDGTHYGEIIGSIEGDVGTRGSKWVRLSKVAWWGQGLYRIDLFTNDISNLWPAQVHRMEPSAEGYATLSGFEFAPQVR